jgi:hypothetical protein
MRASATKMTLRGMPLFLAKSRRPPTPRELPIGDQYLTDGIRLFRVVLRFSPGGSKVALLEDCASLEVTPYSPAELYAMGLRPVRASSGSA